MTKREKLDRIVQISDKLSEISRKYNHIRHLTDVDDSDVFVDLALAMGEEAVSSLSRLGTTLEFTFSTIKKYREPGRVTVVDLDGKVTQHRAE